MDTLHLWLEDARAAHARLKYLAAAARQCSGDAMASGSHLAVWVTRGAEVQAAHAVDALWSAICSVNAHLGGEPLIGDLS